MKTHKTARRLFPKLCLLLAGIFLLSARPVSAQTPGAGPVSPLPPGFDGRQPQLAADAKDGALYLVVGQTKGDLYCARSGDDGKTFGAPVKVANVPGLALGMRRGPRVAAVGGSITVTAIDYQKGQLLAFRSTDRGQTWSPGVVVNTGAGDSAREGLQSLAVRGSDGQLYAVWLDLRQKGTLIYGASSADHGATWNDQKVVYRSPDGHVCECCHPSASFGADGKLAVMWRNWLSGSRDLYVAVSGDGGKTFGVPQKQGAGTWKLNMCPMDGGAVVPLPAGGFASVWQREKSVFLLDNDAPGSAETMIAAGTQPVVAVATDGSTRVVWQDQGGTLMTLTRPAKPAEGAVPSTPVRLAGPGNSFASVVALPVAGAAPVAAWEAGGPNGSRQVFMQALP